MAHNAFIGMLHKEWGEDDTYERLLAEGRLFCAPEEQLGAA